MTKKNQKNLVHELVRFLVDMREATDRIARNVVALHRINNIKNQDIVPPFKNLQLEDRKFFSANLRQMSEPIRDPNRGMGNLTLEKEN